MSGNSGWQLQRGVISVIRTRSAESALTLARGIARSDVAGIEVTMTVPDAIEVIATLTADEGPSTSANSASDSRRLRPDRKDRADSRADCCVVFAES